MKNQNFSPASREWTKRILAIAALLAASLISVSAIKAESNGQLVVVFQKQRDPAQMKAAAEKTGKVIEEILHKPVAVQVPSDYSASVQALVSKRADVAYMDSLSFLLAKRDGGAAILLGEERLDASGKARTEYDSVFVAAKGSKLNSFDDLASSAKDLRIAFTSRTSTSGYLFPYLRFVREGVLKPKQSPEEAFKSVVYAGSYDLAVKQVLTGRADVAAVSFYSVEGSAAEKYLSKEDLSKIKIIARTSGVPTHVIAVRGGMPENEQLELKRTFLELSHSHPELLDDVYGTSHFVEVDPQKHALATQQAVEALGVFPTS